MMEQKENKSLSTATEEDKPKHTFDEWYEAVLTEEKPITVKFASEKDAIPVDIIKFKNLPVTSIPITNAHLGSIGSIASDVSKIAGKYSILPIFDENPDDDDPTQLDVDNSFDY